MLGSCHCCHRQSRASWCQWVFRSTLHFGTTILLWSDEGVIFTGYSSKSSTYIGGLCLFQGRRLRPATAELFAALAGRYRRCKAPATLKHLQGSRDNTRQARGSMCQTLSCTTGMWSLVRGHQVLAHWNHSALQLEQTDQCGGNFAHRSFKLKLWSVYNSGSL